MTPLMIVNARSDAQRRRHARNLYARMTSGSATVKWFFMLMSYQQMTVAELALRAGLRRRTISDWATRRSPSLLNFEAALNVLGYELVIVKRKATHQ